MLYYILIEEGKQREIRYATNQDSPLVDEQKGEATLGHIRFMRRRLKSSKRKTKLTKTAITLPPIKR